MTTRIRNDGVVYPSGEVQGTGSEAPIWAGRTNLSNVRNSYRNFPNGTKVAFWDERNQNTGFTGNGSRNLTDWWRRVYRKDGNNAWTEVGG